MSTHKMFLCKIRKFINIFLLKNVLYLALCAQFKIKKVLIFFLFLHENVCCGYSSEASHQGAFNVMGV